jgi:7-cyano-7-deazaguanine synthase
MTSVVLLSGGMDSTLTLAIAREESERVAALHLNYRHRTEKQELQAFTEICDHYDIKDRLIIDLEFLRKIGGSSLTDRSIEVGKADLESHEIPQTYVPFRNGNFLAMAASWAEIIKAERIYIGAVEEDSSGYPDCRRVFFDAFEQTIDLGTRPETRIRIMTPLISMKKSSIVAKAMELKAPLALTWSCYQSEAEACGECDSCALRLRGFAEAGHEDPIPYKNRPVYT